MSRREFAPDLDVLARLAEAFVNNHSLKKTHIHLASKVSWISYGLYLEWLRKRDYIRLINYEGDEKYRVTEGGREMFYIVLKLKEIINLKKMVA